MLNKSHSKQSVLVGIKPNSKILYNFSHVMQPKPSSNDLGLKNIKPTYTSANLHDPSLQTIGSNEMWKEGGSHIVGNYNFSHAESVQ